MGQSHGGVGPYATTVQLEFRHQAVLAGSGKRLNPRQNINVDVSDDQYARHAWLRGSHASGIVASRRGTHSFFVASPGHDFQPARSRSSNEKQRLSGHEVPVQSGPARGRSMQNRFMEKAIALAIENVRRGRGGPFAAVVVRDGAISDRSEEHTSELQSLAYLVCRLLLEK